MSGWIKFDKDMALDPRLVKAAAQLQKLSGLRVTQPVTQLHFWCNALRGALVTLWCYADEHITDDDTLELTSQTVDAVVNLEGFFAVIPRIWVTELDDGRIHLPGYCKKNGLITKRKRALEQDARDELAVWTGENGNAAGNGGVTHNVTTLHHALDRDIDLDIDIKNKKGPTDPVESKLDTGPVLRVFEHWKVLWKHPNAKLDPKRRRIIATALKAYSETDLRNAIEGYLNSSHHCGENERQAVYDDIGLFLRDAAHIDAGLNFRQGHRAPAKVDLIFRRQEEYQAYKAAVEQGLSFSTQSEWDSHYGHQTH